MSEVFHQQLDHATGRSAIRIGAGVLARAADEMGDWLAGRTLFVVTTPRLLELHAAALAPLRSAAKTSVDLVVEDGEGAKAVEVAHRLWDEMLAAGGKRDSRLLTFGGGTAGDLGGFVAACFLRGIEYSQIPTTLLAQVDASIGGKTGVDLAGGKNTVGAFHHPAWVISDTAVLGTLDPGEVRSGLVEVVKMAALLDPPLFERVEAGLDALLAADAEALAPVIAGAAAAKVSVVERDEREGGLRRVLNYGHTLGHAIEGVLAYEGLRHGEAVAYGMLFADRLAARRGLVGAAYVERLRGVLRRFELPPLPALDAADLGAFMARDKKATEEGVTWVLPSSPEGSAAPGRVLGGFEMMRIPPDEVLAEVGPFLKDPWDL